MIAGILLAAGASMRMRGRDKLLEDVDGMPLLAHMIAIAEASRLSSLHVVLPPKSVNPARHVIATEHNIVVSKNSADGMAESLRAGMAAVPPDADGVMVLLADMPLLQTDHIDQLIARFRQGRIVRAVTDDGEPGHPVLFAKSYFDDLAKLRGDEGARSVLRGAGADVMDVAISGKAATLDLDTPEDWALWRTRSSRQEL